MEDYSEMQPRRVYYWAMWCAMCGGEFKASRKHAFLCSARCRKAFNRLSESERDSILEHVCQNHPRPKTRRWKISTKSS